MKKAYLIRMSEDGNDCYVYTNIKALFNGINKTGYTINYISSINEKTRKLYDTKFTYANLVSEIKKGSLYSLSLHSEPNGNGYGSITLEEVIIRHS